MGRKGDMRQATWTRRYRKWQRWIAELRDQGCDVTEPPNFDRHPDFRTEGT